MGNNGKSLGGAGKGRAMNNDDIRASVLHFLNECKTVANKIKYFVAIQVRLSLNIG